MLSLVVLVVLGLVSMGQQQCFTPRDTVRHVSSSAEKSLLQSELQFSVDLLDKVTSLQPGQNVFFSPHSIFKALLLTYFMSASHTENSLKKALNLASNEDKLDIMGAYTMQKYYGKLRSVMAEYRLDSANRLYVDESVKVRPCFKELFEEELLPTDFKNTEKARKEINAWVSNKTRGVIEELLSEDQVTAITKLVLVNAAYFKGVWTNNFKKSETHNETFYLSNGTEVITEMMTKSDDIKWIWYESLDAEVAELPYKGEHISMLVVKPRSSSAIQNLVTKISHESILQMVDKLNEAVPIEAYVAIPKFTVDKTLNLTKVLFSLGMGHLYSNTADFGTLTADAELRVYDAIHKAKLSVDEEGCEAAAATGLGFDRILPPHFMFNTPFLYLIYDKLSNVVLFLGVYHSPE